MAASAEYLRLRDALMLQAALVEDFLPRELLAAAVPGAEQIGLLQRGKLMSALREACTGNGGRWRMRPAARRKILGALEAGTDLPDTGIAAALKGAGRYAPDNLAKMITGRAGLETLADTMSVLEQAGPAAPGHVHLLALSSRLDRARRDKATDDLLGGTFAGRYKEIARLLDALDTPQRQAPLKTLHIQGLPGVGKTFLLEELARLSRSRPHIVMVRLDFDRSPLREGAPDAVFGEISRQIGTAMPEAAGGLHELRLRTAERRTRIASETGASLPFDLLHRMIDILAGDGRQLLVLLDTLEVLHGQGATFVSQLLQDIDRFADKERLDISLISAGRGAIFAGGDSRLAGLIPLERLDREVTEAILAKRGIPEDLRGRIIGLAGGNPLRLILVARAVQDAEGGATLGDAQIRDAGNGYLYRAVLSRVAADIREIAAEGLILPELGAWELREIAGPALGMEIGAERAEELLELLEMQRWLVRRTRSGAFAHIPEVRREILELTYAESPAAARRINQRAAEKQAGRNPVLALYHRLQLSRGGGKLPPVDPEAARQMTDELIEDLPPDAQDAVRRARGQRARAGDGPEAAGTGPAAPRRLSQSRAGAAAQAGVWLQAGPEPGGGRLMLVGHTGGAADIDKGSLADLRNMLDSRERLEATHLLARQFNRPFRLDSQAGLLALTHQWQTGHWSMARVLFDLLPEDTLDQAVEEDIGLTGLALLELWAEFRFDALCARMEDRQVRAAVRHALSLSGRSGLGEGALAMACLTVLGLDEGHTGGLGIAARHLQGRQAPSLRDLAGRSHAVRAEYGMEFAAGRDPQNLDDAGFALLAAPLNPYAVPMRALFEDGGGQPPGKAGRDLGAFGASLAELCHLFAPDVEGVAAAQARAGTRPGEVLEVLNALGLTTEFARGYTFYSPIPDLPTIARAAERWQQAALGLWRYGRSRPDGWAEPPADPLAIERADRLLGTTDPAAQALRMLRIWDNPLADAPAVPPAILRRRLAGPYAGLAGLDTLEERISHLQDTGLASVLQAPVAALAGMGVPAEEIFNTGAPVPA